MRVIAGEAKGRRLAVPEGGGTRAATDRIRETLFGILEPFIGGVEVLDLFAGAGTLGIEALSRGARGRPRQGRRAGPSGRRARPAQTPSGDPADAPDRAQEGDRRGDAPAAPVQ